MKLTTCINNDENQIIKTNTLSEAILKLTSNMILTTVGYPHMYASDAAIQMVVFSNKNGIQQGLCWHYNKHDTVEKQQTVTTHMHSKVFDWNRLNCEVFSFNTYVRFEFVPILLNALNTIKFVYKKTHAYGYARQHMHNTHTNMHNTCMHLKIHVRSKIFQRDTIKSS